MEVVFSINNRVFTVNPSTVPVDTTLNTFIRSHVRLTGTKFMCLEGGCGVCLVNISGVKTGTGESRSFAVNSCLWLVYACHGLNVTTIEGIGNRDYGYHPIQTTLYHYNGSQCGYCSPAMVINMYSLLEANGGKVTMGQVENAFGGNICRCTGYRPILDAFKSLAIDAPTVGDIEEANVSCCRRQRKSSGHYRHVSVTSSSSSSFAFSGDQLAKTLRIPFRDGRVWYRAESLQQIFDIFDGLTKKASYMLVAGDTAHGVYRRSSDIKEFIDINGIVELHKISIRRTKLVIGGNVSLNNALDTLAKIAEDKLDFAYCKELAKHLDLVATVAVRNAGTIAGNLSIKHAHNEFASDIFLLLETIGAQLNIVSTDGPNILITPKEYLSLDMNRKVLLNVTFPKLPPNQFVFRSYKIMPRAQNAHAFVNAAFLFEFETSTGPKKSVKSCRICYGGINPKFIHAEATEKLLTGIDDLYTNENLQTAIKSLQSELQPDSVLPDPEPEYRRNLAIALLYRFFLKTSPTPDKITPEYRSGANAIDRPLSSGSQIFDTRENLWPLTEPILKKEGIIQCSGEAQYTNDAFSRFTANDELWAAFVQTTEFHEKISKIDASKALQIPGVHSFYTAKDIPGRNSFIPSGHAMVGISEDEELFVGIDSRISYYGQPCGMILANSMSLANYAASQVKITYKRIKGKESLPAKLSDVLSSMNDSRDDQNNESETETEPDSSSSFVNIAGSLEIGTQYHYPMEPQTTFCVPADDGGLDVYAATQWFDLVQIAIAECLNIAENRINITVKRLGGAYGAKLSRSSLTACACSLGCYLTGLPVRFVQTIETNMTTGGKRYATANEYNVIVDSCTGKIQKLNNFFVQDNGCSLNEHVDIIVFEMFANGYASSAKWKNAGKQFLTNTSSSSWCRAPGSTECIAMMETIIEHIAHVTKLDAVQVRLANMPDRTLWKSLFENILHDIDYFGRKKEIDKFNEQNRWRKRGIAVAQMKFPINYYGPLPSYVAIYHGDGTVMVCHGGVECGQGINTKVAQIAAYTLGIPLDLVTVKATNNHISANGFMTAASVTSDSVCLATKKACKMLLQRIKPIRDRMPENASWSEVIEACHKKLIDLTAKYTFIPPDSKPYIVYGCSCAEIEWDALTGNLQISRVELVEDTGRSMSPLVDVGQIEGAFMMGVGYWLTEKYVYDLQTGELLTNRTWTYKTPGAKDIPIDFRVKFIDTDGNNDRVGVLRSKATGEPALCLSVVVVFALRHALRSIQKDNGMPDNWISLGSGLTPDQLALAAPVNIEDFLLE